MKILNLDDFLKLPAGILFSRNNAPDPDVESHTFTELAIKGETREVGHSFDETLLERVDCDCCSELEDIHDNMIKNKESRPINDALQMENVYNKNQRFLIFERDDIDFIMSNLNEKFY